MVAKERRLCSHCYRSWVGSPYLNSPALHNYIRHVEWRPKKDLSLVSLPIICLLQQERAPLQHIECIERRLMGVWGMYLFCIESQSMYQSSITIVIRNNGKCLHALRGSNIEALYLGSGICHMISCYDFGKIWKGPQYAPQVLATLSSLPSCDPPLLSVHLVVISHLVDPRGSTSSKGYGASQLRLDRYYKLPQALMYRYGFLFIYLLLSIYRVVLDDEQNSQMTTRGQFASKGCVNDWYDT